jgi:hypothetical protein
LSRSRKDPHYGREEKKGGGKKSLFMIIVSVLGYPKELGGLNFQFPRWARYRFFSGMTHYVSIILVGRGVGTGGTRGGQAPQVLGSALFCVKNFH